MEDIRTDTVDELMKSLAEAYVDSKAWAKLMVTVMFTL